jgi:predicted dehydrogenase
MKPSDRSKSALVVGSGSAGQRHRRVLSAMCCEVFTVSRRPGMGEFTTIAQALSAFEPAIAVVATETADHARVLAELASHKCQARILVEKPLFGACAGTPLSGLGEVRIGFPLRQHASLRRLKEEINGQKIVSAQIYCGQYLPDWRPDRDHRDTYSSDRAKGGGVLHDLSHELDYALWLFGACTRLDSLGGTFGTLGIKADDSWAVLARFERCPMATLQINYLFRPLRRDCVIVTADHSYVLDLRGHTLTRDGEMIAQDDISRDTLTHRLLQSFLEGSDDVPDAVAAGRVDELIRRIETAGQQP